MHTKLMLCTLEVSAQLVQNYTLNLIKMNLKLLININIFLTRKSRLQCYNICVGWSSRKSIRAVISKFKSFRNAGYNAFSKMYESHVIPVIDYSVGV